MKRAAGATFVAVLATWIAAGLALRVFERFIGVEVGTLTVWVQYPVGTLLVFGVGYVIFQRQIRRGKPQ